jgi:chaperone BCS1
MEDIDAALSQTLNRETGTNFEDEDGTDGEDRERLGRKNPSLQDPNTNSKTTRSMSKVTLSGLLNALDGLAAQEGRILFATTNKYDSLDPALCRPGRMDIHLEFKLASQNQAKKLFRCFYIPDSEGENKGRDEDGCVDSGYCSDTEEKTAERVKSGLDSSSLFSGHQGSVKRFNELATEFAETIPEREFSMASLQGYLMGYKVRPVEAVEDAPAWVENERRERREREKKGKV